MLMRTDPFRELDRFAQQAWGGARSSVVPMDAYRKGDQFFVHFDLPGIDPDTIDLTVERNVLTVKAERPPLSTEGIEFLVTERPTGSFTRQLLLGETLDPEHIEANYDAGVLTLSIPVHEAVKPRRVEISSGDRPKQLSAAS